MKHTLSVFVLSALAAVAQQSDIQVEDHGRHQPHHCDPGFPRLRRIVRIHGRLQLNPLERDPERRRSEDVVQELLSAESAAAAPGSPRAGPAPPRRHRAGKLRRTMPGRLGGQPVDASYLAVGYAGVQGTQFVAFGYLFNTGVADVAGAQVFSKFYIGPLNEDGRARRPPTNSPPTSSPVRSQNSRSDRRSTSFTSSLAV